jgi:hypothetical protein
MPVRVTSRKPYPELKSRGVRWYTSLIGKASSIPFLVDLLKQENVRCDDAVGPDVRRADRDTPSPKKIDNYILLSIRQAHTTRWIIGWSFTDIRLPDVRVPRRSCYLAITDRCCEIRLVSYQNFFSVYRQISAFTQHMDLPSVAKSSHAFNGPTDV